jgi:hypothetical protein
LEQYIKSFKAAFSASGEREKQRKLTIQLPPDKP